MRVNLHVYPSPMTHESRMLRITGWLAHARRFDEIVLVGTEGDGLPREERLDPSRRIVRLSAGAAARGLVGKLLRSRRWGRAVERLADEIRPSCVNAHSLAVLPVCARIARKHGARLVYDTHELETETVESRGVRRQLARFVERRWIRAADAVSVVNEEIAAWYRERYHLRDVTVVRNVPSRRLAAPPERTGALHRAFGVPEGALLFLYQGVFSRGRGLDSILTSFAGEGRHHVLLLGYGSWQDRVDRAARDEPRIHVRPAVSPTELASLTVEADVGLSLIEDVCLSYRLCLPNKLFEYLNAGIPVVVSESPPMVRVVESSGAGWVVRPQHRELRGLIDAITPTDFERRRTAARAMRGMHAWEDELPALAAMYDAIGFGATR